MFGVVVMGWWWRKCSSGYASCFTILCLDGEWVSQTRVQECAMWWNRMSQVEDMLECKEVVLASRRDREVEVKLK